MKAPILNRIEQSILASLPSSGPVDGSAIRESRLPEGVKHFLLRTLERRAHLEAERTFHGAGPWFNQDDSDFHALMQETAQRLTSLARFPADEWPRAARQAAENVLDFLVEPANTLARFVFSGESDTVPAASLRRRASYFIWYPYIGRAVDAWLSRRERERVDRTQFESTMVHLDRRLTAEYGTEDWMELLGPLGDLMQFAGIQPAGLPVPMVIRFFEAKDQAPTAAAIAAAARRHRADMITLTSLQSVLASIEAPPPAPAPPPDPAPAPARQAAAPTPAPESTPETQDNLPLWKRFQQRTEPTPTATPDPEGVAQPLWKSFKKEDGSTPPAPAPADTAQAPQPIPVQEAPRLENQHVVLGTAVRQRDRFIRELFDGNEDTFRAVMADLVEAPDWATASAIIANRVFRPYRIDIYSTTAVDFTNAVEARYSGTAT
ncbi:MAG: hypothetical protein O3C45_04905 [Bacteroidetes bacterium]|nr:hypothetical protein [Bacteroidota bacterium]